MKVVIAVETMSKGAYMKHLLKRHVRITMTKTQHDQSHADFPEDYNHTHEGS